MKRLSLFSFIFIIIIFVLKFFFFDIVVIPSNSMLPTLFPGNYVLISKVKKINRFDIVVFHRRDELYIKRVVAVGNDIVSYVDDKVILNKKPLTYKEAQIKNDLPDDIKHRDFRSYYEIGLINSFPEKMYQVLIDKNKIVKSYLNIFVPVSSYYVLGDNRNHSSDSRDYGVIKSHDVLGAAIFWW